MAASHSSQHFKAFERLGVILRSAQRAPRGSLFEAMREQGGQRQRVHLKLFKAFLLFLVSFSSFAPKILFLNFIMYGKCVCIYWIYHS